jgi:hypothetical protein
MKSVKSQLLTDFFECALASVQRADLAPNNAGEIDRFFMAAASAGGAGMPIG